MITETQLANTLQVEKINRYVAQKERRTGRRFTIEERNAQAKTWIALYASHFRRWYSTTIKADIELFSGECLLVVGKARFRDAVNSNAGDVRSITRRPLPKIINEK